MSASEVLRDFQGGILTLTFNRPQRRNAMNGPMYRALARALREARVDDAVRVVILAGAEGYFTAGNDLSDFVGFDRRDEFVPAEFLRELAACDKPVVAAVEKGAIGVGATLLLHCDFVYAGRSTRLHMPFIHLSVCPEGGSSVLVPIRAGSKRAARWLMLGEPFGAQEAYEADIVTEVVEDGAALERARQTADRLSTLSIDALLATKRLLRQELPALQGAMNLELERFTELLVKPPAQMAMMRMLDGKDKG
jgi:enoyl-CoA hydratase/carnithine racemase